MNVTTLAADWDRLGGTFVEAIWDTLAMVSISMVVGGVLGLAVGVLLFTTRSQGILKNRFIYTVLNVLVNFIRPIPFIIMIAAFGPLTQAVVGLSLIHI